MKRTRLLLLARVTALPFIGYVIHKHSPSTGNKVCTVPRTAYITTGNSFTTVLLMLHLKLVESVRCLNVAAQIQNYVYVNQL